MIEVQLEVVQLPKMGIPREIGDVCRVIEILIDNPLQEVKAHRVDVDDERYLVVIDGPRHGGYFLIDK